MMNYRRFNLAIAVGAIFGFACAAPAFAYVVTLDHFRIERNGALFFEDTFAGGGPPPSGPAGAATYTALGTFSEAGGRVIMDTSLGVSGALEPRNVGQFAVLLSNVNPGDLAAGLKSDDTIKVEGRFDLVLPPGNGDRYGIRLTDRRQGGSGTPPDQPGDDVLEIAVLRGTDGVLRVQFRELDFVALSFTDIADVPLIPAPGYEQILLRLERKSAASNDVTASFDLIDVDSLFPLVTHTFLTAGNADATIFNGENWTRGQFVATEFVPEPGTLALLGLGLVPLVLLRAHNKMKIPSSLLRGVAKRRGGGTYPLHRWTTPALRATPSG